MKKSAWRVISQVIFLTLFGVLLIQGRVQLWIGVLGIGAVISLFLGRIYCGWVCPMGSLMRFQTWLYKKLNISRFKAPKFLQSNIVRSLLLIAFLAGMAAVKVTGIKINVLFYLVLLGVGLSFFFTEDLWHRICPHGTILNIISRIAPWGLEIFTTECADCGLCEEVCPNDAIVEDLELNSRMIDQRECLACFNCQEACPADAVGYNFQRKQNSKAVK